jgi:hypothetical protein
MWVLPVPQEDYVAGLGKEGASAQVGDHVAVERWLMIEGGVFQ